MRVLVCGDRNWSDYQLILDKVRAYVGPGDVVIHGAARGADTLGGRAAEYLGFPVAVYHAKWGQYGRGAGVIRNQEMLDSGLDLVLAFHDNLEESKGTKDMVKRARKKGIITFVFNHDLTEGP